MFGSFKISQTGLTIGIVGACFLGNSLCGLAALAQAPNPNQTTMSIYRVVSANGRQYVVTPSGLQLPLPAPGIDPRAQELSVYRDPQGNFWYYDRYGAPVKVTAGQIQWKLSQMLGGAQQPVQQTTNVYQQAPSSGSSALATGVAAATGAAVGGLVAGACNDNYYYGVPYGVPIYRAGARSYYYNNLGKPVYINNSTHTNTMINTWNKQTTWNSQLQGWQAKKNDRDGGPVRTFDGTGARTYAPQANDRFDRDKFDRDRYDKNKYDRDKFGRDDNNRFGGRDGGGRGFDRSANGRINAQAHGGRASGHRAGGRHR